MEAAHENILEPKAAAQPSVVHQGAAEPVTSTHAALGLARPDGVDPHVARALSPDAASPANRTPRAAIMRSVQRAYGNRAVQGLVTPGSRIQRKCACGGTCSACSSKAQEPKASSIVDDDLPSRPKIARSPSSTATPTESPVPAIDGGSPIEENVRERMEHGFGEDFSGIRIHTDHAANQSAATLGANAFTFGRDIYFGAGRYNPSSHDGARLLAHELTHTVQQSATPTVARDATVPVSSPEDPEEREAERVADAVTGNSVPAAVTASAGAVVQRDPNPNAPGSPAPATLAMRNTPAPGTQHGIGSPGPLEQKAPDPGEEGIRFENVLLSTNAAFVRYQLEQITAWTGLAEASQFVFRLIQSPLLDAPAVAETDWYQQAEARDGIAIGWHADGSIRVPLPKSREAETRHRVANRERVQKIIRIAVGEYGMIYADAKDFLADFEKVAQDKMFEALGESQTRVEGEAQHYGISPAELVSGRELLTSMALPPRSPLDVMNDLRLKQADADRWAGAQGSRRELIKAVVEIQKRREWVHSFEVQLESLEPKVGYGFRARTPLDVIKESQAAEYRQHVAGQLEKAKQTFNEFLHIKERQFPIIAAFAHNGGDLSKLTQANDDQLKQVMLAQINEKLQNIYDTRDNMRAGKITPWSIPFVVEATRRFMKIDKGTMLNRVLNDYYEEKKKDIQDEKDRWKAVSAISLALGLLALIPTPLTPFLAVASAGLGAAVAYHDLQDYIIESAASGTDFDKARAISQEDPSLFWLAVELIGTMVDLGAAAKSLRAIGGLRRAVIAGEEGAVKLLETEAGKIGPQVAERVVQEAEAAQRAALSEARGGGRAAEVIEEEAIKAAKLGETSIEHGGHTYWLLKDGTLVRCSKICSKLNLLFGDLFKRYPHLNAEFDAVSKLKGKAATEAGVQLSERMEQVRRIEVMTAEELEKALESPLYAAGTAAGDDLRYIRYQRAGGVLEFEEFIKATSPGYGGAVENLTEWGAERTQGARDQLRSNLERIGAARPPTGRYQAHHIIPYQLRNHPLIQRLRMSFGWDINEVHNGVLLPERASGSVAGEVAEHLGSHPAYNSRVEQQLWDIEEKLQSGVITEGEALHDVGVLEDQLRAEFVADLAGAKVP